jgi:hypothetical protein
MLQQLPKEKVSVVIKGFMNEPTRLKFCNSDGNSVTVLCRDGETQMNFAIDVVYQYDAEAYRKLREAFESDDSIRLEEEWQKAKPIMST